MKRKISDEALAQDPAAQLEFIAGAYEINNADAIDAALTHVTTVRRMKSKGLLDMFASYSDEPDEDAAPS
ncbi:hypothetical protein [Roseovarius sp. M141]|uniref:hypothetical protein n=1 Tax=Roseovarius sp. M141 TaxID=2583806 RepID=UPI0020CDD9C1|nr:hypothetical protein [Roseovarius sp. M141]MCQ0090242.1 hypothetical protein [Roseovarius sp. M141]